uniref:GATA-type domain-containing protein n=1 Tax=Panagrolaimus davidi TaxID=227884 RepID=A0A914PS97_9BILA
MSQFGSFWSQGSAGGSTFRAGSSRKNGEYGRRGSDHRSRVKHNIHHNMILKPNKLRCWNCKLKHSLTAKCPFNLFNCESQGKYREIFRQRIQKKWSWEKLYRMFLRMKQDAGNSTVVQVPEEVAVEREPFLVQKPVALSEILPEALSDDSSPSDQVPSDTTATINVQAPEEVAVVAELKNGATSSVVKFEEKEIQTCQSFVNQTTQTEHIIFDEYYQNNDIESNEEEMEIDDTGYSDITKPSISEPLLRKSTRIKECAAEIPNLQDETKAADDSIRDECVSTPEDFKLLLKCKIGDKTVPSDLLTVEILEKCKIHRYVSACGTKFNGDTDSALVHLSANGYSIKRALESIDNPDSIPMKRIHENLGIWSKDEMDAFVKFMSNNYQWNKEYRKKTKHPFWIEQFQKMFPKKSHRNCLNFYYTLKSAGFSYKDKEISKFLPKKECLNCVKQLWKSQSKEQQVSNLCGLCKLYFELYGKQRPNAKALPLHFNLSPKRI